MLIALLFNILSKNKILNELILEINPLKKLLERFFIANLRA